MGKNGENAAAAGWGSMARSKATLVSATVNEAKSMSHHGNMPVRFLTLMLCLSAIAAQAAPEFFNRHCVDCHDAETKKGGLDLTALGSDLSTPDRLAVWTRIHDRVMEGAMPPAKKQQPEAGEKAAFLRGLAASITAADAATKGTVMRRLNRTEYEHTLHDLLGVRTKLAEMLPEDGKAGGFDNVGEALDLSAIHLQRYMDAAKLALRDAVKSGPKPEQRRHTAAFDHGRNEANLVKHWHKLPDGGVVFFNSGNFPQITPEFSAPSEGKYRITLAGRSYQTADRVAFSVYAGTFGRDADTRLLAVLDVAPAQTRRTLEVHLGAREKLRFMPQLSPNQPVLQREGPAAYKGEGLVLMPVEIEGPILEEWPGRGHRLLFGDLEARASNAKGKNPKSSKESFEIVPRDASADARRLLTQFVPTAFRRPVTAEKVLPYIKLAESEFASGASFYEGMLTAYVAVLCSPDFLFLKERPGKLDAYSVAARLSYMIWGSAPDEALLAAASKGELATTAGLRAQTERLLSHANAERFTKNFTGQWLNLREIDFTTPDRQLYPEFNDGLKHASLKETELFFEEVLKRNLSVNNFIDSDWTMLNEPLSRHYGITGVEGVEFRRVALKPENQRGGVMTHASVLKVTANGTSTSPVVRGIWVLERILGMHPSPPPPGVPGVEPDIRGAQTLRQQLDKHRDLESCNSCHRVIDPPGFALENYDVIGGWRDNYRSLGKDFPKPTKLPPQARNVQWRVGPVVDASGSTPEGQSFRNLSGYKKLLLERPERFTRTLSEKLAVYATGRSMGFSDRAELERVATAAAKQGNGFRDLVHEVIQSQIFQNK